MTAADLVSGSVLLLLVSLVWDIRRRFERH